MLELLLSKSSDVIALFALAVAGYVAWRQRSQMDTQDRLNKLLLQKEETEAAGDKRADLDAAIVKIGERKHRLKVWNAGKAAALNVSISFPEGNDFVIQSELREKLPLERLERHQSVELISVVHNQTKRKQVIRLTWADSFNEANEKIVYLTL